METAPKVLTECYGATMTYRRDFGSIRKLPSGKYQARYTHPHTGMRHTARDTYPLKGDANAWLVAQQSAIMQGTWKDTASTRSTLGDYGLQWIAQQVLKPNVRENYLSSWRIHILPQLGALALPDLTSERVRKWKHDRLAVAGDYAVKNAYSVLRAVMNTALDDNIIKNNPCNRSNSVRVTSPKRQVLTPEQLAELSTVVPKHYAALVLVLGWVGLRIGEATALRLSDLSLTDPDHATVRIERRVYRLKTQELHFDTPKSAAGDRLVSLPLPLVSVIQLHISNAGIVDPAALVFTTQQGNCAITAAPKEITYGLRKLGFNNTRTHDLRATAATAMTNSGASLIQVMHTLGHSTVDAAMRYQRATPTAEREISLRIADHIVLPDNVLPLVRKVS